ncbi:MAG TPA: hypothetical protein VM389_01850, partial [Phycisphaerae bacterium]|nr:hypothetical protein [Phycisphaerae bacterium]
VLNEWAGNEGGDPAYTWLTDCYDDAGNLVKPGHLADFTIEFDWDERFSVPARPGGSCWRPAGWCFCDDGRCRRAEELPPGIARKNSRIWGGIRVGRNRDERYYSG